MANPFNEERRQRLEDDAKELLAEFSKEYVKMFGVAVLQKIEAEIEGGDDQRKLKYRNWKDVDRPELFIGDCYVKSGGSAFSFGKWTKQVFVERQDYNIDYYASEQDQQEGINAKGRINMAGYGVQINPAWYYAQEERCLRSAIGADTNDVKTSLSPYAWALTDPNRTNFVFQLHESKNPSCCSCFSGGAVESDDVGSEFQEKREEWLQFMSKCVSNASARDKKSVRGKTFEMTCRKMTEKCQRLSHWSCDGTETEILTSMLITQCLTPLRDPILQDLVGPTSLKIKGWYKAKDAIQAMLTKLVGPAWEQVQTATDEVQDRIEPIIRKGLGDIFVIKKDIKNKIREEITDKIGNKLAQYVTPYLKPVCDAFGQPLAKGLEASRHIFSTKVSEKIAAGLPSHIVEVKRAFDTIPRTKSNIQEIYCAAREIEQPVKSLKSLNSDIFDDVHPCEFRENANTLILETLDAAINTLELRLTEHSPDFSAHAEEEVSRTIQDFEHDAVIQQKAYIKKAARDLLIPKFKTALSPVTKPIIGGLNGLIPKEMEDFLNVESLYDEIIDLFVGEPIDKMVHAA